MCQINRSAQYLAKHQILAETTVELGDSITNREKGLKTYDYILSIVRLRRYL